MPFPTVGWRLRLFSAWSRRSSSSNTSFDTTSIGGRSILPFSQLLWIPVLPSRVWPSSKLEVAASYYSNTTDPFYPNGPYLTAAHGAFGRRSFEAMIAPVQVFSSSIDPQFICNNVLFLRVINVWQSYKSFWVVGGVILFLLDEDDLGPLWALTDFFFFFFAREVSIVPLKILPRPLEV